MWYSCRISHYAVFQDFPLCEVLLVYRLLLGEYFTRGCFSISGFNTLSPRRNWPSVVLPVLEVLRPPVLLHYSQYSQHEINVLDTPSILGKFVATPDAAFAGLGAADPLAPLLLICHVL